MYCEVEKENGKTIYILACFCNYVYMHYVGKEKQNQTFHTEFLEMFTLEEWNLVKNTESS